MSSRMNTVAVIDGQIGRDVKMLRSSLVKTRLNKINMRSSEVRGKWKKE